MMRVLVIALLLGFSMSSKADTSVRASWVSDGVGPPHPMVVYRAKIAGLIQAKLIYPAEQSGSNPRVVFEVLIAEDGVVQPDNIQLLSSSGDEQYNLAVKQAILAVEKWPPFPAEDGAPNQAHKIKIVFRLK